MRLWRKRLRTVTVYERLGGEECPVWGEGEAIRAGIQPASVSATSVVAAVYGRRITDMLRLLYVGKTELIAGMGVRVDAEDGEPCDYEIVSVSSWTGHTTALLEKLDAPRRAREDG